MKLLLIVDDYLPRSIKVAAKMIHELALELQLQGHEVTVLSPDPFINKSFEVKIVEGIRVLFFRSGKIKNISKIRRAINESLLSFYAWRAAGNYLKNNPHDAIVYYSPSIFWGQLVGKLKKIWCVKTYLILRDIFPQWTIDNGLMTKNSPIHLYFKFFEELNYKYADYIGVMSHANLDFFESLGRNIDAFEVLNNWASDFNLVEPGNQYRKGLNLEQKVVFFYGGNIGYAQNIHSLVSLAISLKQNPKAHFLFVGNGDQVDFLLQEKENQKLDNLTYLPPVSQKTYFEMLNEFDIGLFSLHPNHNTHNFPGKLLGYMQYAKPILGTINTGNDLKNLINSTKSGFIYDSSDDHAEILKTAALLIESPELRKTIGGNAKELLKEHFSVQRACVQITQHF